MIQLKPEGGWVLGVEAIVKKVLDVPKTQLVSSGRGVFDWRRGPVEDQRDKDEKQDKRHNQGDRQRSARHGKSFPLTPGEDSQDGNVSRTAVYGSSTRR
jgi:hypothetical protein